MSFANVGTNWSPDEIISFRGAVVTDLLNSKWKPAGVCFHHTGNPTLSMRPDGFTVQHLRNMRDFYQLPRKGAPRGWSSGPHLFVDDRRLWGMTPFGEKGIHAVAFNSSHWGIEVLGEYDGTDSPLGLRGLKCWRNAARAAVMMLGAAGLLPEKPDYRHFRKLFRFHRDDPSTSKTCPGTRVNHEWVAVLMSEEHDKLTRWEEEAPPSRSRDEIILGSGRGGRVIPVLNEMSRQLNVPWKNVAENIKVSKGYTLVYGKELSGAVYDKDLKCTVAPEVEISRTALAILAAKERS